MIRITAKSDRFRRCGVVHREKGTVYPDDKFTEKELKILKAEPMLMIETIKKKKAK